jgi:hypothetical protein
MCSDLFHDLLVPTFRSAIYAYQIRRCWARFFLSQIHPFILEGESKIPKREWGLGRGLGCRATRRAGSAALS